MDTSILKPLLPTLALSFSGVLCGWFLLSAHLNYQFLIAYAPHDFPRAAFCLPSNSKLALTGAHQQTSLLSKGLSYTSARRSELQPWDETLSSMPCLTEWLCILWPCPYQSSLALYQSLIVLYVKLLQLKNKKQRYSSKIKSYICET